MICLEFETMFVPPILDGTKGLTLRRTDTLHTPRHGEKVALISGPNVIGIATVFGVRLVGLSIRDDGAAVVTRDGMIDEDEDLFARADGFADEWKMGAWYESHYHIGAGRTMAFMAIEFGLDERRMPW